MVLELRCTIDDACKEQFISDMIEIGGTNSVDPVPEDGPRLSGEESFGAAQP